MYLSHVVRTMRDDPTPTAEVTLLVRLGDDATAEKVRAAANDIGADPAGSTTFDAVRVELPQSDVAAFLDRLPTGVKAVETDAVTGVGGDAGEDL